MDSEELFGYVVLFSVCGLLALKILKLWWPTYQQRKKLSVPELIEHAIDAPAKERLRQKTMFGTAKETLKIHAINVVLLTAWLYTALVSNDLFLVVFFYISVGFVVIKVKGMPVTVDKSKLEFMDRVTIRLYYAWQWPALLLKK